MKGALDGKEVYKNLEVGFKEECLAIIYPSVQLPRQDKTRQDLQ
jgi:hypothetical protein